MIENLTADALTDLLRESTRLFLPGTTGEPLALRNRLEGHEDSLAHLSVLTNFVAGLNDFAHPVLTGAMESAGFFPASEIPAYRQIIATYSGIGRQLAQFAPDITFVPTTIPDARGYVGCGLSAEFVRDALETSGRVVALANPALPRLINGDLIHRDEFSAIFNDEAAPLALASGGTDPDDIGDEIARNVVSLVDDGAAVQCGIGKVPSLFLDHLRSKKRLRVHSGIVTESIRGLVEADSIDREFPIVCATIAGSHAFYCWLDGREDFLLKPVRHTHSASILSRIEKFVAVNSALQVDLLGQVNSEGFGAKPISAPGGLPEFCRAGHQSSGGCSIIALPSTASRGKRSRIVPSLASTLPVTIARTDVDFVVTEYGIADLRAKTASERAAELVAIAHPYFRASLIEAGP